VSDLWKEILSITPWAVALTALIVSISALFSAFNLQQRSRSKYDDEHRRAELSLMRESYERRISSLVSEMMATEQRWRDVNHLVVESQFTAAQSKSGPSNRDGFFTSFGINLSEVEQDSKLIFVLTPFAEDEQDVFQAIKEVCVRNGFRCVRGDEENATGGILAHIVQTMARSRLVIANISTLNQNVFYELGIAQAMGKRSIIVSQTETDIPFDLTHQRIVTFRQEDELKAKLTEALLGALS